MVHGSTVFFKKGAINLSLKVRFTLGYSWLLFLDWFRFNFYCKIGFVFYLFRQLML